ncbi:contractile injection system protein, VgrG/Pvc8 family [Diaphorobacter caeni]|uniref:contractile injection system protein, VgrG/Pvc8 family n=1 Tax=Diaphorobacter caeni TaxID=2784387 RepID=UPI0018909D38|nr:contractile injection system protein, VgrG/Pvc8 family [Diaphorobacter caeni]MBF5003382.1 phage late control D family protein [Diaphorobacter caeni]
MIDDGAVSSRKPVYHLVVNGKDISQIVRPLLMRLSLRECRGGEADQLDITLDDSQGNLALPPKGASVSLQLGYEHTGLVDKGTFTVDEVEHSGAPDVLNIRCRSAELRGTLRQRASASWHGVTLGDVVRDIAAKNNMVANVDEDLAEIKLQHVDQTNESDVHFLTRIGGQYDATATVKKGRLVVLPIGSTKNASGKEMASITLERTDGDQHRYHAAARDSYSGVRAYWHDAKAAKKVAVISGTEENMKTLRDSYASEADALAAAQAEQARIVRGEATFELSLAVGQPALMVQTPVRVRGFKKEIDGTGWLAKTVEHSLDDNGLTTRLELERKGGGVVDAGGGDWDLELEQPEDGDGADDDDDGGGGETDPGWEGSTDPGWDGGSTDPDWGGGATDLVD